jgi:hypothetical protein
VDFKSATPAVTGKQESRWQGEAHGSFERRCINGAVDRGQRATLTVRGSTDLSIDGFEAATVVMEMPKSDWVVMLPYVV